MEQPNPFGFFCLQPVRYLVIENSSCRTNAAETTKFE